MPSVDPVLRGMNPADPIDSPDRVGPPRGYPYPPGYLGHPPPPYHPLAPEQGGPYNHMHPYPPMPPGSYGYGMPVYGYGRPSPWMSYEGGPYPPPAAGRLGGAAPPSHPGQALPLPQQHTPPKDPLAVANRTSETHSKSVSMDDIEELERVKAEAAAELNIASVKPIQTDFHFFVKEMSQKLRNEAEQEVEKSMEGNNVLDAERLYLINSNLNCLVMKAWEDLSTSQREQYFKLEEEDRKRFMEEDEVASRHCVTLTARIRSPSKRPSGERGDDEDYRDGRREDDDDSLEREDEDDEGDDEKRILDPLPDSGESPPKKNRTDEF